MWAARSGRHGIVGRNGADGSAGVGGAAEIGGGDCGGTCTGLRAGAAAGCGGGAEILWRMPCSALAMLRAICSWPAASRSMLCRTAARSRAIASSCCGSEEGPAGAIGATISGALCALGGVCAASCVDTCSADGWAARR